MEDHGRLKAVVYNICTHLIATKEILNQGVILTTQHEKSVVGQMKMMRNWEGKSEMIWHTNEKEMIWHTQAVCKKYLRQALVVE